MLYKYITSSVSTRYFQLFHEVFKPVIHLYYYHLAVLIRVPSVRPSDGFPQKSSRANY